jgi:hypothetical protein
MGTDMVVHTEVMINGEWHHYGCPYIERNYALFAMMADVRNEDGEYEPLGFEIIELSETVMTDTTLRLIKLDENYDPAFGNIYRLNLPQIKELVKWYESTYPPSQKPHGLEGVFGYVIHNGWAGIPNKQVQDARFIFYFD